MREGNIHSFKMSGCLLLPRDINCCALRFVEEMVPDIVGEFPVQLRYCDFLIKIYFQRYSNDI